MKHHDKTQAQIEAGLVNAIGSDPAFRGRVDNEQITGATMLRYLIPYDEATSRVTQALKVIKGTNS